MTATLKAIDTRYDGHLFRSRLEARWAVAFNTHRIEWNYEPEGFDLGPAGYYLPDFWLPQVSMWAEVKPAVPSKDELGRAHALANASGHPVLLLVGKPSYGGYWAIHPDSCTFSYSPDDDCAYLHMDYDLFGYTYHLSEHRFYASCGYANRFPTPMPDRNPWADYRDCPVRAALEARFEYGATPTA